jgi:hypothetical protein
MLQYAFLQHATPVPSHDTTRGLIQLTTKLENGPGRLLSFTPLETTEVSLFPLSSGPPRVYQAPSQLDFLCTRESLLYYTVPQMTSPYQCQFLSSKHQVMVLYCSSLDLGLLCSRVTINFLGKFLFSSRKTSQFLCYSELCVSLSPHCTIYL